MLPLAKLFFEPISKALMISGSKVAGTAKIGLIGGLIPPDL